MAAAASGGRAFSPLSLSPTAYLRAAALDTLFQEVAGETAVSEAEDTVGAWNDLSANGFDLTAAADDATRPLWHPDGGAGGASPYVLLDGTDDYLFRAASIGAYAAGASSWFVAVRGNPAVIRRLAAEGSSASDNPIYDLLQARQTTASTGSVFIQNDAASTIVNDDEDVQLNAFDNTDNVYGVVDDGSSITGYLDGVASEPISYTRSGTLTLNRFAVGALLRASPALFFAGRVYALVIVNRVLTADEIANLTTSLGAEMGRVL